MATATTTRSELPGFIAKFDKSQEFLPAAMREGAYTVGGKIKTAWLAEISASGVSVGGKIKGRSWGVGYDIMGTVKPALNIRVKGPLHLWFGSTIPHIIAAARLGSKGTQYTKRPDAFGKTRRVSGGIASKASRLSAGRAFGGSGANRGVFGKVLAETTSKGLIRAGRLALTIPGADGPRAYAFHPGTRDHMSTWEQCKIAALRIAPEGYRDEATKALLRSGFGTAKSVGSILR